MEGLSVGELARRAGVNLQTIHYYERRALLPKPPRTASNYRVYPRDAVRRVRFIKHAQELGFMLEEIKELISLRATPRACCNDVRERAERKAKQIDDKIRSLKAMRKALAALIAECSSGEDSVSECPILEALDAEDA